MPKLDPPADSQSVGVVLSNSNAVTNRRLVDNNIGPDFTKEKIDVRARNLGPADTAIELEATKMPEGPDVPENSDDEDLDNEQSGPRMGR